MSHGQFFENSDLWLIYESYIWNIYIFWIRILWRILWECFRPRIFRIRPRKILKNDFLRNAWPKNFFVPKFEKNAKIHVQWYALVKGLSYTRPRRTNFQFLKLFDAYAQWKYFLKGWNCDHHVWKVRLSQKNPKLSVFGHALYRKVMFLSWKLKISSSF